MTRSTPFLDLMVQVPVFTLNTGQKLPAVGLGCWMGKPGDRLDDVEQMCSTALKLGYRSFDTARSYGNEEAVGKAINASGVPREDIFVTTKLRNIHHHCVKEAFEESLAALDVGYIDLYLMHWPMAFIDGRTLKPDESPTIVETWREMEKLLVTGKVKAIGVSNFSIARLQTLIDRCTVVPAVNQFECHPSLPQFELVEFCQAKGIQVTAYSSLGQPGGTAAINSVSQPDVFFHGEPLKHLGDKYQISVGQILLSWAVQRGINVIPKSEKEARLRQNLEVVRLDDGDMEFLNNWHKADNMHRSLCPYHSIEPYPHIFGWTYEMLQWPGMGAGGVISKPSTTD
ncbi:Aldo/keto reductase [Auriculariales sp. MPI-PUGE-AT-0066]|nr:Aldo/keto reductase [Auriculariales sp. MPI-PUGE-AT-0066]